MDLDKHQWQKAIGYEDILYAREVIKGVAQKTEMAISRSLSSKLGSEVFLKCENTQTTGSFKIRGAYHKIMSLTEAERSNGIVACSAGNHAQGVAFSARAAGAKASIVMPKMSPLVKIAATESYGAKVILHGSYFDEAFAHAKQLVAEFGYQFVHPYEDPYVIAGQGTVGLEIIESLPDVDSVIVSIGGGGLISGIATAIKHHRPQCRIYGVVTESFPGMHHLIHAQSQAAITPSETIADGIAVKSPSQKMYDFYIKRLVDGCTTVKDSAIAKSITFLLERAKAMVEGAGAASLAALLDKPPEWDLGKKCCIVLSGGNIDLNLIAKIIERGLAAQGRVVRVAMTTIDRPGGLNRITSIISESGANILDIRHNRFDGHLDMRETELEFLLETRSWDHIADIQKSFATHHIPLQIRSGPPV